MDREEMLLDRMEECLLEKNTDDYNYYKGMYDEIMRQKEEEENAKKIAKAIENKKIEETKENINKGAVGFLTVIFGIIYLTFKFAIVWPCKLMYWLIKICFNSLSIIGGIALLLGGKGYRRK